MIEVSATSRHFAAASTRTMRTLGDRRSSRATDGGHAMSPYRAPTGFLVVHGYEGELICPDGRACLAAR